MRLTNVVPDINKYIKNWLPITSHAIISYIMLCFIDESGDHQLSINMNDEFPVFVLGAILIDENEHKNLTKNLETLKQKTFGTKDIILHTAEMTRPHKVTSDKRFTILTNKDTRNAFYKELDAIIKNTKFESIFCIIDKKKLIKKYKTPHDPYELSFENLLNRIITTAYPSTVNIYPEQRSSILDTRIELLFEKYKQLGTRYQKASHIQKQVTEFKHVHKHENLAGAQLIDLLVTPIARDYLIFKPKPIWNEIQATTAKATIKSTQNITIFP